MPEQARWFYSFNREERGPISETELAERLANGQLTANSLIWREGQDEWHRLARVAPHLLPEEVNAEPASTLAESDDASPTAPPLPPLDERPVTDASEPTARCAASGWLAPQTSMLRYGNAWVLPQHKDRFLQQLREGTATDQLQPLSNRGYHYADPRRRAAVAKGFFALMATCSIALSLYDLFALIILRLDGDLLPGYHEIVDRAQPLILLVTYANLIVFLMWTHRVCRNAWAIGGDWLRITPGWAVGWYFIPIAALWKPYQATAGVWRNSFGKGETPHLLGVWWTNWIASGILPAIYVGACSAGFLDAGIGLGVISLLNEAMLVATSWLLISQLTARQVEVAATRGAIEEG